MNGYVLIAWISDYILKPLTLPPTCHKPQSFSGQKVESQPALTAISPLLSREQEFLRKEFLSNHPFKVKNNT